MAQFESDGYNMHFESHSKKLLLNLLTQKMSGVNCDVKFVIGDSHVWAHSSVLFASPATALRRVISKKRDQQRKACRYLEIDFPTDFDKNADFDCIFCLSTAIDFIYVGELTIQAAHSRHLLLISKLLNYAQLSNYCRLKMQVRNKDGRTKYGKDFFCRKCSKSFSSKNSLKCHQSTHTNLKPYKCAYCPAQFKWKCLLTNHSQAIHERMTIFYCDLCEYTATLKSYLRHHITSVHVSKSKPYACAEINCGFRCAYSYKLKLHSQTHRGGAIKVNCQVCGCVLSKGNLNRHIRKFHLSQGDSTVTDGFQRQCPSGTQSLSVNENNVFENQCLNVTHSLLINENNEYEKQCRNVTQSLSIHKNNDFEKQCLNAAHSLSINEDGNFEKQCRNVTQSLSIHGNNDFEKQCLNAAHSLSINENNDFEKQCFNAAHSLSINENGNFEKQCLNAAHSLSINENNDFEKQCLNAARSLSINGNNDFEKQCLSAAHSLSINENNDFEKHCFNAANSLSIDNQQSIVFNKVAVLNEQTGVFTALEGQNETNFLLFDQSANVNSHDPEGNEDINIEDNNADDIEDPETPFNFSLFGAADLPIVLNESTGELFALNLYERGNSFLDENTGELSELNLPPGWCHFNNLSDENGLYGLLNEQTGEYFFPAYEDNSLVEFHFNEASDSLIFQPSSTNDATSFQQSDELSSLLSGNSLMDTNSTNECILQNGDLVLEQRWLDFCNTSIILNEETGEFISFTD